VGKIAFSGLDMSIEFHLQYPRDWDFPRLDQSIERGTDHSIMLGSCKLIVVNLESAEWGRICSTYPLSPNTSFMRANFPITPTKDGEARLVECALADDRRVKRLASGHYVVFDPLSVIVDLDRAINQPNRLKCYPRARRAPPRSLLGSVGYRVSTNDPFANCWIVVPLYKH